MFELEVRDFILVALFDRRRIRLFLLERLWSGWELSRAAGGVMGDAQNRSAVPRFSQSCLDAPSSSGDAGSEGKVPEKLVRDDAGPEVGA